MNKFPKGVSPIPCLNVLGDLSLESLDILGMTLLKLLPKFLTARAALGILHVEVLVAPDRIHQLRELLDEVVV